MYSGAVGTNIAMRIRFDLNNEGDGRVYKNGAAWGTSRFHSGGTWTTYSEDLSGAVVGDTIELWTNSGAGGIDCRNFRIYFDYDPVYYKEPTWED